MHSQLVATILATTVAFQGVSASAQYDYQNNGGSYNKQPSYGATSTSSYTQTSTMQTSTSSGYSMPTNTYGNNGNNGNQYGSNQNGNKHHGSNQYGNNQPGCKAHKGSNKGHKVHKVIVGGPNGLVYTPCDLKANVGDIVEFEFLQKNHTVTQSTLDTPCKAMDKGFKTGFVPNLNGDRPGPMKKFKVKDNKPMWFYCGQKQPKPHCGGGNQMVFAINAKDDKQLKQFQDNAKNTKV